MRKIAFLPVIGVAFAVYFIYTGIAAIVLTLLAVTVFGGYQVQLGMGLGREGRIMVDYASLLIPAISIFSAIVAWEMARVTSKFLSHIQLS